MSMMPTREIEASYFPVLICALFGARGCMAGGRIAPVQPAKAFSFQAQVVESYMCVYTYMYIYIYICIHICF